MKNLHFIAYLMLFSVVVLITVMIVLSVVMHKIPSHIALIVSILFGVPDTIIAIVFLKIPYQSNKQ